MHQQPELGQSSKFEIRLLIIHMHLCQSISIRDVVSLTGHYSLVDTSGDLREAFDVLSDIFREPETRQNPV